MADQIEEVVARVNGLYAKLAVCHPSLQRGQVWCQQCGHTQRVDAAVAFRHGWPKHCGYTMTIDPPADDQ